MTQSQSISTANQEPRGTPHDDAALPQPPSMAQHLKLAWTDFVVSLTSWRMWLLLGMNDIRQRYRRSRLGQFWITMAMATTIGSLGVLYAYLFKVPLALYLPYLGASFVIWSLISTIVLDACNVFISAEGFMRQVPLPKSVFVYRMLVRNLIIFLHNVIILPPLFLIFRVPIDWTFPLAFVGVFMIALNGVWIGLFLGTICARFRDLPQIIASLVQVAFYLTPVMWRPRQLPEWALQWAAFNPFQAFLEIVRDPLLGLPTPPMDWVVAVAVTVIGFAGTTFVFARFRARIIYWL
jgi:ABC-type polysaccharide/polyol phosphate export permease